MDRASCRPSSFGGKTSHNFGTAGPVAGPKVPHRPRSHKRYLYLLVFGYTTQLHIDGYFTTKAAGIFLVKSYCNITPHRLYSRSFDLSVGHLPFSRTISGQTTRCDCLGTMVTQSRGRPGRGTASPAQHLEDLGGQPKMFTIRKRGRTIHFEQIFTPVMAYSVDHLFEPS
jgi:hypothetical protein